MPTFSHFSVQTMPMPKKCYIQNLHSVRDARATVSFCPLLQVYTTVFGYGDVNLFINHY